jgi:hypothetical protein
MLVRRETEKCVVGQISKNSSEQAFHDQFTPRGQQQVDKTIHTIHTREKPHTGQGQRGSLCHFGRADDDDGDHVAHHTTG